MIKAARIGTADARAQSGLLHHLGSNITAAGRDPMKSLIGFVLSWAVFFFILYVMPTPAGLTPAGKATLAVVVWACITWITECVPVGISGLMIPMLLVMTGAVDRFANAVGELVSQPALLTIIAFIVAAIIQTAGLDKRIALGILHRARIKGGRLPP